MRVLGISGGARHAAAAVSIDSEIVAAAAEESFARVAHVGSMMTGGYPVAAVDACLVRAGLTLGDIDRIVVVADVVADDARGAGDRSDGHGGIPPLMSSGHERLTRALRARATEIDSPLEADARQVGAACTDEELAVLVLASDIGASAAFRKQGHRLIAVDRFGGANPMFAATSGVSEALGLGASGSYDAVERLGSGAPADHLAAFDQAIEWTAERGVVVHDDRLRKALEMLPGSVEDADRDWSLHVRVQQDRQTVAASFSARVRNVVAEMAASLSDKTGIRRVGVAGSLCSNSGLARTLGQRFGDDVVVAPVPEPAGRAIGAALNGHQAPPALLRSLALGPQFSESDIKETLDNCRLDYVYEPDWHRLLARLSRMLTRGSIVAWFQGPMGFGPRAVGTRSILGDPSNRYARDNINRFLRRGSVDDPLTVSMTGEAIRECLEGTAASPFLAIDARVKCEWRERLRAAVNPDHMAPVQLATMEQSPALVELLTTHRQQSGVPGLIQTPLSGIGEPTACTPRDAVRTMFSSAVDALVIGRFLLMKDYWLLRSGSDQRP